MGKHRCKKTVKCQSFEKGERFNKIRVKLRIYQWWNLSLICDSNSVATQNVWFFRRDF